MEINTENISQAITIGFGFGFGLIFIILIIALAIKFCIGLFHK